MPSVYRRYVCRASELSCLMGGGDLSGGEKRTADELTAVVLRGSRYRQSACVSGPCVRVEKKNPVGLFRCCTLPGPRRFVAHFTCSVCRIHFPTFNCSFLRLLWSFTGSQQFHSLPRVSSSLLDWGLSVVGDMQIKLHAKVFLVLIFGPQLLLGF